VIVPLFGTPVNEPKNACGVVVKLFGARIAYP
jgi:hypothetical protein